MAISRGQILRLDPCQVRTFVNRSYNYTNLKPPLLLSLFWLIIIRCDDLSQYERISKEIKTFFNRRGIHETTIQAEIKSSAKLGIGSDICLITAEEQPKPTLTANQSKLAV